MLENRTIAEGTQRACMSVQEVAHELGVSNTTAYDLARREDFPAIHLGKRIVVPRSAFMRWLDKCAGTIQQL